MLAPPMAPPCAVICRDAGLYAVAPPRTVICRVPDLCAVASPRAAIAGLYVEVG